MFFDHDILFRAGSLSIVWRAGNGEFSRKEVKTRRNALYQRLLQTDIASACEELRKLLPRMGSAYGLSLKKASILLNGVGVIYCSQMEFLMREVIEMQISIRATSMKSMRNIDLPPSRGREQALEPEDAAVGRALLGFGFGELGFLDVETMGEDGPRVFPVNLVPDAAPLDISQGESEEDHGAKGQRGKKRRTDEVTEELGENITDADILNMLGERARQRDENLLREDDMIPGGPPAMDMGFGDFDFMTGGGFGDEPFGAEGQNFQAPEPLEIDEHEQQQQAGSPPGRRPTGVIDGDGARGRFPGHGRNLEEEGQDLAQSPELPVAGEPGGTEGPSLSLEDLDTNEPLLIRRGRKGRRLEIDDETTIAMERVLSQMQTSLPSDGVNRAEVYMEEIKRKGARAGLDFIEIAGRRFVGQSMKQFMETQRKQLLDYIAQKRDHPEAEDDRRKSRKRRKDAIPEPSAPTLPEEVREQPSVQQEVSAFPGGASTTHGGERPEMDQGLGDFGFDMAGPSALGDLAEEMRPPSAAELQVSEEEIGADLAGSIRNGDKVKFKDLFPPQMTSRRKAATAFFSLLSMHKGKRVVLEQEEFFGEILITGKNV